MKLYHGTNGTTAKRALTEGLLPRSETGVPGNWDEHPSQPGLVYLTAAYAPYFAMAATEVGESWGIVEVNTDLLQERDLLPDEDFLEQASRGQDLVSIWEDFPQDLGMGARTAWFRERVQMFAHLWEVSLGRLGNCAHQGAIPPQAITRVSTFDPTTNPLLGMAAGDPVIAMLNYQVCGAKYRAMCQWLMGEDVEAALLLGIPGMDATMAQHGPWKDAYEQWRGALGQRAGLHVICQG